MLHIPNYSAKKFLPFLAATAVVGTIGTPAGANTRLECVVAPQSGSTLSNTAALFYKAQDDENIFFNGLSNLVRSESSLQQTNIELIPQGIHDSNGNQIIGLGYIADGLTILLKEQELSAQEASQASQAAITSLLEMPDSRTLAQVVTTVQSAMAQAVPSQAIAINRLSASSVAVALMGVSPLGLSSLNIPSPEVASMMTTAQNGAEAIAQSTLWSGVRDELFSTLTAGTSLETSQALTQLKNGVRSELTNLRNGGRPRIEPNATLSYQFLLKNTGSIPAGITLPNISTLQATGTTGVGSVKSVQYEVISPNQANETSGDISTTSTEVNLKPGEHIRLKIAVQVGDIPLNGSGIALSFGTATNCGNNIAQQTLTVMPPRAPLVDPLGRVTGCRGEILPDYSGFKVGLYEPDPNDPTGGIRGAVPLTRTELPNNPNNNIPKGIEPNTENSNPFFLTNSDEGRYSFLFDQDRGQLDLGRTYILMVTPPNGSIYNERRIRIVIGDRIGNIVQYTATSLDGRPISVIDPLERTIIQGELVVVEDAERLGLDLAVLDLGATVCQAQEIRIDKTGDRATAEPGDIIIYRVTVRNLSPENLTEVVVDDTFPTGINLLPNSVRAQVRDQTIQLTTRYTDRLATFSTDTPIPTGNILTLIYAAQVTPDAIRGSGINSATVNGRIDNRSLREGPATHQLEIRPGILSDCGTIIGRVFIDSNGDGEQQANELGVPHAVIYLENGNRVVTDENGMFTLANVLPGYHTGTLDLTSLPGYTLAPNVKFRERNSLSRLVRIAPGSMVRMNFAVTPITPTPEEEVQP